MESFIHSNVAGITFKNSTREGGVSRQKIIAALLKYPREMISINVKRKTYNIYDPRAIAVYAQVKGKGEAMIGYLSKDEAYNIAPRMDSGNDVVVILGDITGGAV